MANRQLDSGELEKARTLLASIRKRLRKLSGDDVALFWALRRKVYKELSYDERGKPAQRKRLKKLKLEEQRGLCAIHGKPLQERGAVLDRFDAMAGYTRQNTRLICPKCDRQVQASRGYK